MTTWRRSSHSNTSGGQCVEVAKLAGNIGVRDSKAPGAGHLTLSPAAFTELLTHLRATVGLQARMTQWRKSRRSANSGQTDCVEVARLTHAVGIRDSKAPGVGHLTLSPAAFAELVAGVKRSDLDG